MTNRPDMKIPLDPGAGRVLLVRRPVGDCWPGTTIVIPEDRRAEMERTNYRATVVAVGADEMTDSGELLTFPYEVDDEVFIDRWAGFSVPLYGSNMTMTLARFREVMAKWLVSEEEFVKPDEPLIVTPEHPGIVLPNTPSITIV